MCPLIDADREHRLIVVGLRIPSEGIERVYQLVGHLGQLEAATFRDDTHHSRQVKKAVIWRAAFGDAVGVEDQAVPGDAVGSGTDITS